MRVSFSGGAARGLLLVSALLASTSAFAAPDAKAIADSVVAAIQAKGKSVVTYDSATASGDDVTITNLKITGEDKAIALIPSLVIASPAPRQPGGFTASSLTFDNGSITEEKDQTSIKWATGSSKDAIIPDPSEMHSTSKITPFSHLEVGSISISGGGMPDPVTVAGIVVDLGNIVDGAPNDGKLQISDVTIPNSVLQADEQAKGVFDALGYQTLTFNLVIDGSYDSAKNTVDVRAITLDGKDMGKLAITGNFGGLPRDKLQNPDQLGELGATATLENASVRFDDAGLTGRLLDMQAKSMGATRESLATMLPAALPMAFSSLQINDQALQQKVVDAASAFLKDPKSITISLSPSAPVLLKQVGEAAMSAPASVPGLLGFDIKANN